MATEKLKEWIRQKQEEGISNQRIKKSLEKTGYDPSIVDELDDPFDSEGGNEPSGDLFSSSGQDSEDESSRNETEETDSRGFSDDSRKERIQNISSKLTDQNSDRGQPDSTGKNSYSPDKENSSEDKEDNSSFLDGLEMPSISAPEIDLPSFERPSGPSVDLPSMPSVSKKQFAVVFTLLLVIGGGAAAYSFLPDDFNPRLLLGPDLNSATHLGTLQELDERFSGCPDLGVSIQNVTVSKGSTHVDTVVTGEAWVVVEIQKNGEVIGYSTEKVNGDSMIKVNKVGDTAELRPLGCETRYSRQEY